MEGLEGTRDWVSLRDAQGDDWIFDLTFLTSAWTCIYGRGCPGVLTGDASELEEGCCSYGAHLTGEEDRRRVEQAAARLTDQTWQHRSTAARRGGPFKAVGSAAVSRLVADACIFLNRPGFPGGAGCALHRGAVEAGERPLDWKPDVCWQLPLRLVSHTDEHGRSLHVLREWERRDWGSGGAEFHWWCTESQQARTGVLPVYLSLRDEISELIGPDLYQRLVRHIERNGRATAVSLSRRGPGAARAQSSSS